jgi:hypothetical protein
MSDTRLRELERAASGGDEEAEARLLRERLRTGFVFSNPDHVALMAYTGFTPAEAVLGWERGREHVSKGTTRLGERMDRHWTIATDPSGKTWRVDQDLATMAEGMDWFGKEACVALGVSAMKPALDFLERAQADRIVGALRTAVTATLDWLECPCLRHASVCCRLVLAHERVARASDFWICGLLRLTYEDEPSLTNNSPSPVGMSLPSVVLRAVGITNETLVRAAIRNGVVKWAINQTPEI